MSGSVVLLQRASRESNALSRPKPLTAKKGLRIRPGLSLAGKVPVAGKFPAYYRRVGAGTMPDRNDPPRKRQEILSFWAIIAAVGFPVFLAYILVAFDLRSDLSQLKPVPRVDNAGAIPVGWAGLEGQHVGGKVRMIGYMMGYVIDGYDRSPEGTFVDTFILLPQAGQLLRPAHRIPAQMVEVQPCHPIPFHGRALVWVIGALHRTAGHNAQRAAWVISDARVEAAKQREIVDWFWP
jgi:hypothetical protein